MMQEAIVAAVVACAAIAVLKRYLPMVMRNAMRAAMARVAKKLGWNGLAQRLARSAHPVASCGDGCGTCGGCGAAGSPADGKHIMMRKLP